MTKLIIAFLNFVNAPKNGPVIWRSDAILSRCVTSAYCSAVFDGPATMVAMVSP